MNIHDDELSKKIHTGVKLAVSLAIQRHKLLGQSIVVSENGKVVEIPANKIEVPPRPELPQDDQ